MENMQGELIMKFVKPELLVLIVVLYFIGNVIKKSKIKDNYIPLILGGIGILLSGLYILATTEINGYKELMVTIFTILTQGVLCSAGSVYINQMWKQLKDAKTDDTTNTKEEEKKEEPKQEEKKTDTVEPKETEPKKYKYPLHYIALGMHFIPKKHYGIDMCWSNNYGGKNVPIYASNDGVVYWVVDHDETGKSWGNLVKIKHNDGNYTLYAHLLEGVKVKQGQEIKQGDLLGYMGNTGKSLGNHLHFEFYKGGASTSKRVDALEYVYAYNDQVVHKDDAKYVKKVE